MFWNKKKKEIVFTELEEKFLEVIKNEKLELRLIDGEFVTTSENGLSFKENFYTLSAIYNDTTIYCMYLSSSSSARKIKEAITEKLRQQRVESANSAISSFLSGYNSPKQNPQDEDDYVFDYSTELGNFNTSGGEFCLDDSYEAEDNYCLEFHGGKYSLSVQNIPSKELKGICKKIFDHLAVNSHRAKIEKIHQDGSELTWE